MLLRGRNTVGFHALPDGGHRGVRRGGGCQWCRHLPHLRRAQTTWSRCDRRSRPSQDGHGRREVALCYTGDLLDPRRRLYTLDYYLRLADQIVEAGAHIIAIKDMAGLLRPAAAAKLVAALRERFDLPVHLHTHDTPGGQLATLLAAQRRRRRCRGCGVGTSVRHHEPAVPVFARRSSRAHRAGQRDLARRRVPTSSRTGKRCASGRTLRSSPGFRGRRGASTPRDPRRSALESASAGEGAGPRATTSSSSRTCTQPPTGSWDACRR